MARVFRIMVRCPVTGRPVDTGIRTSGREVLSSNIYQGGMVNCPHCRQFHPLDGNAFSEIETNRLAEELWRPNP